MPPAYQPNYRNLRTQARRKRNAMMKRARHYHWIYPGLVAYLVSEARAFNHRAVEFDWLLKGKPARDFS